MLKTFAVRFTCAVELGLGDLPHLQGKGEVLEDGLVRIERVVLEDHRQVAVLGIEIVDRAIAEQDLAGGDVDQPRDQVERRRLAAAGRTDQRHELAIVDLERNAIDGDDVAVGLAHLAQRHTRHCPWLRHR